MALITDIKIQPLSMYLNTIIFICYLMAFFLGLFIICIDAPEYIKIICFIVGIIFIAFSEAISDYKAKHSKENNETK